MTTVEAPARRNLAGPFVLITAVTAASAMANFFLPVYFKNTLGFSGSQIGLLYALFSVTAILAVVPVGLRNDRTSPRWLIAVSLAVTAVAALGMAAAHRFSAYLAVFLLYGLGLSSFRISLDALMFKTGDVESSGTRWGTFNGFRMVGMGMGTFCAGHFLTRWSFPAGLTLLAAVVAGSLLIPPFLSPVKVGFPRLSEYVADLRNPRVLGFMGWLFLFSLHWGAELTCYGLFLSEKMHLTLTGMGWYMGVEFIIVAVTCYLAGPRCDQGMDTRRLAILGLVLSGVGQILMCRPVLWESLLWRSVHGVGDGLIVIVMYLGIARLFDPDRVGGHNSGVNLVMMLGAFVGSLLFGPLGAARGYDVPLWATGALVIALSLPLLRPRVRKRPVPPSDSGSRFPGVLPEREIP
jgi:MFS family permease